MPRPTMIIGQPKMLPREIASGIIKRIKVFPTDEGDFTAAELATLTGRSRQRIYNMISQFGIYSPRVLNDAEKKGGFEKGHKINLGRKKSIPKKRLETVSTQGTWESENL